MKAWGKRIVWAMVLVIGIAWAWIEGHRSGEQKAWSTCSEVYKAKCSINANMMRLLDRELSKGGGK